MSSAAANDVKIAVPIFDGSNYNVWVDQMKFWLQSQNLWMLQLQTIKAIVDGHSFKSLKSDEPRRVQVLDLYCLTRFEGEGSSKGIVY